MADPVYPAMNAPIGVYWRSAPSWSTAEQVSGFGFYNGTLLQIHCWAWGTTVPGISADTMWESATDVGGPGYGSGWVNEHFINDGQPINQPSPGVGPCPPGGGPGGGGSGGPACTYSSCNGQDPNSTGCSNGATTLDSFSADGYYVELRYSPSCHAAWARASGSSQNVCNGWTNALLARVEGSTGRYLALDYEHCLNGGIYWTNMVSFHYWTRACLMMEGQPLDYPNGNPPEWYVRCTGWH